MNELINEFVMNQILIRASAEKSKEIPSAPKKYGAPIGMGCFIRFVQVLLGLKTPRILRGVGVFMGRNALAGIRDNTRRTLGGPGSFH